MKSLTSALLSTASTVLVLVASPVSRADVIFNWVPVLAPGATSARTSGQIVISDAAFAAGGFSATWRGTAGGVPIQANSCTGATLSNCVLGSTTTIPINYFSFTLGGTGLSTNTPVGFPMVAYNRLGELDISARINNGQLVGSFLSRNPSFSSFANVSSDASGLWTVNSYNDDFAFNAYCGAQGCSGDKGRWVQQGLQGSVPLPGTLALALLGLFGVGLFSRQKNSRI